MYILHIVLQFHSKSGHIIKYVCTKNRIKLQMLARKTSDIFQSEKRRMKNQRICRVLILNSIIYWIQYLDVSNLATLTDQSVRKRNMAQSRRSSVSQMSNKPSWRKRSHFTSPTLLLHTFRALEIACYCYILHTMGEKEQLSTDSLLNLEGARSERQTRVPGMIVDVRLNFELPCDWSRVGHVVCFAACDWAISPPILRS